MLGYLDQPEATAAKFRGDWFLTGDSGEFTPSGDILYHGRADDMMNAGGFRVSPLEVETVLLSHPAVHDVGVTDIEIKADARVIAAYVVTDKDLNESDLADWVATRLARYKQPRVFRRVAALSRNANGKLMRRALPQLATL